MQDPKDNLLVKSVEVLVTQREELATKEKELIESLNAVLSRMGYRVVSGSAPVPKRRGRPPGRKAPVRRRRRKPGRPPKAGAKSHAAVGATPPPR